MILKQIKDFTCPRWEDLPEEAIFNREAVDLINKALEPILNQESKLTTTMVQNYVKWGFLPKEEGRKYSRSRIALLIVISIYKQVISLKNVKKGVDLLLEHFPLEEAFDIFGSCVDDALKRAFDPSFNKLQHNIEEVEKKMVGLYAVANSFALKLLGETIIASDGIKNLGE